MSFRPAARMFFESKGNAEEEMYKELFVGLIERTLARVEDENVTAIASYSLYQYSTGYGAPSSLRYVSFPNATTIGVGAFNGCEGIEEIHLPKIAALPGRCFINNFVMKILDLSSCTNLGGDSYWLQGAGSRRADSQTDSDGNTYKCLVILSSVSTSTLIANTRFPFSAPDTTKFQCSDGYIIYDTSTSSWKAVTT